MSERLTPSSAAIGTATAILGIVVGYFIGSASSLGLFYSSHSSPSSSSVSKHKKSWPNSYDVDLHPDSSDEELMRSLRGDKAAKVEAETSDNDDADEEKEKEEEGEEEEEAEQDGLKAFEEIEGECKLVLIVRTDLGMNKGSSPLARPPPSLPTPPPVLKETPLPQAKSPPKPPTPRYTTTNCSLHTHSFARCYGGGNPQGKRKSLCRRIQKSSSRSCRLKRWVWDWSRELWGMRGEHRFQRGVRLCLGWGPGRRL